MDIDSENESCDVGRNIYPPLSSNFGGLHYGDQKSHDIQFVIIVK